MTVDDELGVDRHRCRSPTRPTPGPPLPRRSSTSACSSRRTWRPPEARALETAFDEADLIDAAARAVAGYLDDLPDLPLVGEPFGGEEGTD